MSGATRYRVELPSGERQVVVHPAIRQLLVRERGWTPDEYDERSGDTALGQLLRSPAG